MSYSMHLCLLVATLTRAHAEPDVGDPTLADVLEPALQRLRQRVQDFLQQAVGPQATCQFEQQLHHELGELGRLIVQWTFNHVEPAIRVRSL